MIALPWATSTSIEVARIDGGDGSPLTSPPNLSTLRMDPETDKGKEVAINRVRGPTSFTFITGIA